MLRPQIGTQMKSADTDVPDILPGRRRRRSDDGESPAVMFSVAAIVSLLVHAAVGVSIYDGVVAELSYDAAAQRVTSTRVERASEDIVINIGVGAKDTAEPKLERPDPSELSEMLLAEQRPTIALSQQDAPQPDVQPFDDARPADDTTLDDSPAPFDLPAEAQEALAVAMPSVDLPFIRSGDSPWTKPTGGGEGGTPRSAAQRSLEGAGLITGRNPLPPRLERPKMAEAGPVERELIDAPLSAPEIDFARIALEGTRQLDVPVHLDDDFDYRLTKFEAGDEPGYFRVDITAKRTLRKLKTMPKDVVFIVDTSGSVRQSWVKAVTSGVGDALATLNREDRFNIVFFNDKPASFRTGDMADATDSNIASAIQFLKGGESQGWTDVNRALSRLLIRDLSAQRVYYLVLITDGLPTRGVMDTRELINLVTKDNDLVASIYCVGVGARQNRELLDFLAYRNKGFSIYTDREVEATGAIRGLMSRLRYPIIKNIELKVLGLDGGEVYPAALPNIHQGETFSIFGRYNRPTEITMRLAGDNGEKRYDFTFTRSIAAAPRAAGFLARDWASHKLHHLYSELLRVGESRQLERDIDQLRRKYKIKAIE